METAILFKLTREQIEAALNINLFHKLAAQLSITAGYGGSLEKTGFTAKFVVSTGFGEVCCFKLSFSNLSFPEFIYGGSEAEARYK